MKIDDSHIYSSAFSDVCTKCKHLKDSSVFEGKVTCTAFPGGIPVVIWSGQNNHRKPFKGDNGIQFELHPNAK